MTEEERQAWNDCLTRGDKDEIVIMQNHLLTEIHTRIMTDDPNYEKAGWKG